MSYCFDVDKKVPSLASMPVHPHGIWLFLPLLPHSEIEDALDPCNSGIGEGSQLKKYHTRVHAKEIPHVAYSSTVSCTTETDILENEQKLWFQSKLINVLEACNTLYDPNLRVREQLLVGNYEDLDNDGFRAWMDCTQYVERSSFPEIF